MTERLYYTDADLMEFTASIVASEKVGDQWHTILDRSAFYPTSGGQLHDTGSLNAIAVIDVQVDGRGEVIHITEEPVAEVGDEVAGRIDTQRRRQHRQAHTAQHLLSHAFLSLYELETVSVHLGEAYSAVELNGSEVTADQCEAVQDYVNERIYDCVPVEVMFVDSDEAARLPLRKRPSREGKLRIVRIGDLDWSACGGTHCNHTGEIRYLQIIGVEKLRGHSLVRFLSGEQALSDYRQRLNLTDELTRELTCGVDDLAGAVKKHVQAAKAARRRIAELQAELLPQYIEQLAAQVKVEQKWPYVVSIGIDLDAGLVNRLATQTADRIKGVVVLGGSGRLIVAVGKNTDFSAVGMVKDLIAETKLRGGGSDRIAQIGNVPPEQSEELAMRIVKRAAKD